MSIDQNNDLEILKCQLMYVAWKFQLQIWYVERLFMLRSCWATLDFLRHSTSIKVRCESRVHEHFSFPLPSFCPEPKASVLLPSRSNAQTQNDMKRERELWVLYDCRILSQIQKDSKHNFLCIFPFPQPAKQRTRTRTREEGTEAASGESIHIHIKYFVGGKSNATYFVWFPAFWLGLLCSFVT